MTTYPAKKLKRVEKHKCKFCGLEDGACICAHVPPAKLVEDKK